jgi:peroxiredoxin
MTHAEHGVLRPGDRAPDFTLPAADVDGTVALGDYRRAGPVLLVMLRGLYCPFCRRHISLLRPPCVALRAAGIALVGVVIGSPERTRQYFAHFPPCFPIAAAPDRALHRAYGLPETIRNPDGRAVVERKAAAVLAELGMDARPGEAAAVFAAWDGFEMTAEDNAEWQRPLQTAAYFLIGRDGVIRWTEVMDPLVSLPKVEKFIALV